MSLNRWLFPFRHETFLPRKIAHVGVPPIKTQGIKTRLVSFIAESIKWEGNGIWFEPFMGSGAVAFNIAPKRAILSDVNPYIINFYNALKNGEVTASSAARFLKLHGRRLEASGDGKDSYYYEMRDRFNETHDPHYFLFLSRSCFNGLMRFNSNGEFNSAFCRNPSRFSDAYISKICNQIDWVSRVLYRRDFTFIVSDWKEAVKNASESDFVYLDPPYYGRDTNYFGEWTESDMLSLIEWIKNTEIGIALSIWLSVGGRRNNMIYEHFSEWVIKEIDHTYQIGPTSENRPPVIEGLIIRSGFTP